MKNLAHTLVGELTQFQQREAMAIAYEVIEFLTGWDYTYIISHPEADFDAEQRQRCDAIIQRLNNAEPLQYILGSVFFYGLKLKCDSRALIPRAETTELVEWALTLKPQRVLDIGTGTGCIALAIKAQCPGADVEALDISPEALALAQENGALNQLEVRWRREDIFDNIAPAAQYDLIVSNPPYIGENEAADMEDNVVNYEPHLALFVPDDDVLKYYKAIADYAINNLVAGGHLLVEINQRYGGDTCEMLKSKGFKEVTMKEDMSHNPRMVMATK